VIEWARLKGKLVGTVLNSSSWTHSLGIIADVTRSGKRIARANHIKSPDSFIVIMHMTLDEYKVWKNWWNNECRRGVHTFAFPNINDNTGILVEYQFDPESTPSVKNTSALNLEITMNWLEA